MAGQFADRVLRVVGEEATQQVQRAYWIALSRPPNAEEQEDCLHTLKRMTEQWGEQLAANEKPSNSEARRKALTTLCHTIMNSALFLYID